MTEVWIIRNKQTGAIWVSKSNKSSWKKKGHAKSAWVYHTGCGVDAEYAKELGVDLVKDERYNRLRFPYFDEQDVYELVNVLSEGNPLTEYSRLLTLCLGRLTDPNLEKEIKEFLNKQ